MKQSSSKKFRILLVASSFEDEWRSPTVNTNSHYPLGLAYIHAYLEKFHHTVKSLFLNDYSFEDCFSRVKTTIKRFKPDIVGFNMLTNNRVSSFRLIEYVHEKYPHIKILIGGIHSTLMYRQIIEKYPYLIAVLGEGEITIVKLLEKFSRHDSYQQVRGIAYRSKQKVITTKKRSLIKNLDVLPFPKHEAFFSIDRTIASMLTSRGCPFHCSFCVLESVSRRIYRKRSVKSVISEIKYLIKKFPQIETIWLHDDQFFIDNQRVIDFCNEIVKQKIKIKFICSGRFKPVSKEMVEALEKAGFIEIMFGLESGSPKVLELCHKMITQDDVVRTITLFKNSKIFVVTFLIVGLYGETIDTIREGYQFVQKIQKIKYLYYGDISILIIYPGTEIYDIAKAAGTIDDSYWLTDKPTPLFTVEHSTKELKQYKDIMLNHISLSRYFTLQGFIRQVSMTPYIIKFLISSMPRIPMVILHVAQRFYPRIYTSLRRSPFIRSLSQVS